MKRRIQKSKLEELASLLANQFSIEYEIDMSANDKYCGVRFSHELADYGYSVYIELDEHPWEVAEILKDGIRRFLATRVTTQLNQLTNQVNELLESWDI